MAWHLRHDTRHAAAAVFLPRSPVLSAVVVAVGDALGPLLIGRI
jgi:hypothetical protein